MSLEAVASATAAALAAALAAGCGASVNSERATRAAITPAAAAVTPTSTEPELTPDESLRTNPPPPRNVRVTGAAARKVTLAWDEPAPVTVPHAYSDNVVAYRVYRRSPGEIEFTPIGTNSERTYTDATVGSTGRYSYQVASIRERNLEGARSDPVDAAIGGTTTTPPPPAPIGTTAPPRGVSQTAVTLRGRITLRGAATQYFFQYGRTRRYGNVTRKVRAKAGKRTITAAIRVRRLAPATVYHYRVVARSSAGVDRGRDRTFRTAG